MPMHHSRQKQYFMRKKYEEYEAKATGKSLEWHLAFRKNSHRFELMPRKSDIHNKRGNFDESNNCFHDLSFQLCFR